MYATGNPKTKKALRAAVEAHALGQGPAVEAFSPGPFPCPTEGKVYLEGPHYPAAHSWYAAATVRGGIIVKVTA